MQQCASRSSFSLSLLALARRCHFLPDSRRLFPCAGEGGGASFPTSSSSRRHSVSMLHGNPPPYPRLFCSSIDPLSPSPSLASAESLLGSSSKPSAPPPAPEARPRMPAVPEPRPKPTTAVAVVEEYLDKLWRDFFTNPHNWFDNRLKRRAPKYADFKNKLTKEGLWITARWNPLWVRTELSLMTNFRAVPYDDPLWEEKRRLEEEERKEKPPPVAPGAWLREELKRKQAKAAGNESGEANSSTPSAPSPVQDQSI